MLNEKLDSEHGDNLEIVEWREDKVGSLFVLCFYPPDFHLWWESVDGKTCLSLPFFSGWQPQDSHVIKRDINEFSSLAKTQERRK